MIGRIWAIATMTLREASRRKVFTILILFAVALLSSTLFFPAVRVDDRLRLMEMWSLRAAAVFTAIVGLFLAGFSLPSDFEQKRIYLLVSKPVQKGAIFLGRFLGYALLLAVFVATMGVLTILFLRTVQLFSGRDFPPLVAYPRIYAEEFTHRGGAGVTGGNVRLKIDHGEGRALIWKFHVRRQDFPDGEVRGLARLHMAAQQDPWRVSGKVKILVRNPSGAGHEVKVGLNTNEEGKFFFPASVIGDARVLQIEISAEDEDGVIAGIDDGVLLYGKSILFERAFARGMALVLAQSLIVLSLTLMASTFLSAPLSILLGILLYLVGSIHGYVREGVRDIDRSLQEVKDAPKGGPPKTPENIPEGILRFSSAMSQAVLYVVPDFAHFDYSVWLLKDHAVSWNELTGAFRRAFFPILVLVVLGTLVMTFKDFG